MAKLPFLFGIFLLCVQFTPVSIEALGFGRNRVNSNGQERPRFTTRLLNAIEGRLAERYRLDSLPVLNTENRVRSRGYPFESYDLVSEDGYRLQLHRIPHGANDNESTEGRPAVLLNHGTFQSSLDWVINYDSKNCLAFVLADAGYDVWLSNTRGNVYSGSHVNLTTSDSAYWNFSHHEMGVYDLPVTIDCILNTTGQEKVHYIGYSLTTASFLILLSEKPEYNEKIKTGVLLAATIYTEHGKAMRASLPLQLPLQIMQNLNGPFPISSESISLLTNYAAYLPHLCDGRLIPTKTWGICRLLRKRARARLHGNAQSPIMDQYSILESSLQTATSSKGLLHLLQCTRTRRFQFYDYGRDNNLKYYQTPAPPEYNLQNAKVPIVIFYAARDFSATPADIRKLVSKLPNVEVVYRVPDDRFSHVDYSYHGRANELVYQHILEVFKRH